MDKIKKVVDNCFKKLKKDYVMDPNDIRETYYDIYLTSKGVRNGTYLEIFKFGTLYDFLKKKNFNNENEYIEYLTEIFKELKELENIDFYIGKLFDGSDFKDTVYVYYKPRKTKLFKIIKIVEECNRTEKGGRNKLQSNIARLLSYEIVKYPNYDDFIIIDFKLVKDGFSIMGYYTSKDQLWKAYDKMTKINNALKEINEYCELVVSNDAA